MANIAFDAANVGAFGSPTTSITWNHTCSGSNRFLVVSVVGDTVSDFISGVTHNGVSMTRVQSNDPGIAGKGRWMYTYVLINPASGSNAVVVNASSPSYIGGHSVSYNGCKQSGQPDNTAVATGSANVTDPDVKVTLTPSVANCWIYNFGGADGAGTGLTADSGTTIRNNNRSIDISWDTDTNGVASGATSIGAVRNGSAVAGNWTAFALSITPIPDLIITMWHPSMPDILLDTTIEMVDSGFTPNAPANPTDPTPN